MFNNPEGIERKRLFNPFGVVKKPYIRFPELHSGLFKFNAFSVFRFVGNGQDFELASS